MSTPQTASNGLLPHQGQLNLGKVMAADNMISLCRGHAGMGKSSMALNVMKAHLGNGGKVVYLDMDGIRALHSRERHVPAAHDPRRSSLQIMAEGVRRAAVLIQDETDGALGYLYHHLRSMGMPCKLIRAQFKRRVLRPGHSRGARGTHPHKLEVMRQHFLMTDYGVMNAKGTSWATVQEAVDQLSGFLGQSFKQTRAPRDWILSSRSRVDNALSWQYLRSGNLTESAREELAFAWMQARTPQSSAPSHSTRL